MDLIKKNLKEKHKELGQVVVPLVDAINPLVYLLCKLYYKEYIEIIYGVGRGYAYTKDIMYFFKKNLNKSSTTVRKELKEMEELGLINMIYSKSSYVILKRNGLGYIKNCSKQKDLNLPTRIQLDKSRILMRLYANGGYRFLVKSNRRYKYLLGKIYDTGRKKKICDNKYYLKNELRRYEEKKHPDFENMSIDELEQMHIYLKDIHENEEGKIELKFTILDLQNIPQVSTLIKINYIVEFVRRLYFGDMERYKQNGVLREKFKINIQIITTTKAKNKKIINFLEGAVMDNSFLNKGEIAKIKKSNNGKLMDLYVIVEVLSLSVRYYNPL